MPYAGLADLFVSRMAEGKRCIETKRQLDHFVRFLGNVKVSDLRVHHIS